MDDSILVKFPDDDHVLGPFLGNLPPEILNEIVKKLGWFKTMFAMAGKTCREVVVRVPSTRAVITDLERRVERKQLKTWEMTPLAVAAMEGDVEAIEWLIQLFDETGLWSWRSYEESFFVERDVANPFTYLAASRGQIRSLETLYRNGCRRDEGTCTEAARRGQLEVLKYAHANGWGSTHTWPSDVNKCWQAATRGGHVVVLQWLCENGCDWDLDPWDWWTCKHTQEAARKGHLKVLQWAHENGRDWDLHTCASAAGGGHLEVLQYAHENGCPWDYVTCAMAAEGGHLEVLQYAHENGCPWNTATCTSAVEGGHLEALQYAHENGCPWDYLTCVRAAEGGHLEVLQYAHENGCPWNEGTCAAAAGGGHLKVLQYAHENGCPWDEKTCAFAARRGHLEVLQYAHENGCPWNMPRPLPRAPRRPHPASARAIKIPHRRVRPTPPRPRARPRARAR